MRKSKRKTSKGTVSRRKASRRKAWSPPDRLSELPDSLILQILSFLEMTDVVRTTILSKRWKDLWTTIPCLEFWSDASDLPNAVAFRNFISRALALWKGGKIFKFSLRFRFDLSFDSDIIDSWLLLAIKKQVEHLSLSLYAEGGTKYCPPQRLFSCSSITQLFICYCQLKIDENVHWNQLKTLFIFYKDSLSEHVVNKMLSGAPRLESLSLYSAKSNENLNIESGYLKVLRICRDPRISSVSGSGAGQGMLRIRAPNLEAYKFTGFTYARCLKKGPTLTDVVLTFGDPFLREDYEAGLVLFKEMLRQDLPSILHVENVTLSCWSVKVILYLKKEMLVQFPNAKFLKLSASTANEIHSVLEMFPKLVNFTLEQMNPLSFSYSSIEQYLAEVDTDSITIFRNLSLPHLREVEITWYLFGTYTIIPVMKFVLENAHLLEKMVVRLRLSLDDLRWLDGEKAELLSIPRSSPTVEVIIIEDIV